MTWQPFNTADLPLQALDPHTRQRQLLEKLLSNQGSPEPSPEMLYKYNTDPPFHAVCYLAVQLQMRVEDLERSGQPGRPS